MPRPSPEEGGAGAPPFFNRASLVCPRSEEFLAAFREGRASFAEVWCAVEALLAERRRP